MAQNDICTPFWGGYNKKNFRLASLAVICTPHLCKRCAAPVCIYLSYVCLCAFVTIHYVMLCYTTLLYQHHMLESGITALPVICIVFIRPLTALSFLIFVFIPSELYFYNIACVLTLKASEFNHFAACDERNSSRSTHHVCV